MTRCALALSLYSSLIHMPTPDEFYHSYVRAGRPVLLSGLLNSTTTLDNWSKDTYLRETFGEEEVEVELGKKENRTGGAFVTTMADYVDVREVERGSQTPTHLIFTLLMLFLPSLLPPLLFLPSLRPSSFPLLLALHSGMRLRTYTW